MHLPGPRCTRPLRIEFYFFSSEPSLFGRTNRLANWKRKPACIFWDGTNACAIELNKGLTVYASVLKLNLWDHRRKNSMQSKQSFSPTPPPTPTPSSPGNESAAAFIQIQSCKLRLPCLWDECNVVHHFVGHHLQTDLEPKRNRILNYSSGLVTRGKGSFMFCISI